ncbi:30S ribosomal protein S4e [Haloglomus irregulare]|jgi:small subunit ribosomal protein S4e|uniref:Small ribosomal subunit protein eS4 n=1 Tax=Haloglomus irregulare TaxID=2234134 RepID=A0A554NEZ2_9EURY|nr:30S ribosomal protein S4e [Haloglomus irregulare]TSD15962.1 30S ribosomal protein S4e [Haloglomus irregulare]
MTRHQKRLSVPNSWPVERKTSTYTVKADAGPHGESGVPLLIVLRDVLGYADSRKETRYALEQDNVLVNGEPASDEERPIGMFDIVEFTERDEHYRVFPDQGGRLALTAIDAESAGSRLGKVVGKTQEPGGDTQLTLHDGATLRTDDGSISTNDSIVVSNDDSSIVAHFPYEEGALVTAVRGSHAGEIGRIDRIQVTPGSSQNNVLIEGDDGRFETVEDYVVVIDENFTDEEGAAEPDVTATDEDEADAGTEDLGTDADADEDEEVTDDE